MASLTLTLTLTLTPTLTLTLTQTSLSFLCQDFTPAFFWWEFVDLTKKVALVGFFVTIEPGIYP